MPWKMAIESLPPEVLTAVIALKPSFYGSFRCMLRVDHEWYFLGIAQSASTWSFELSLYN